MIAKEIEVIIPFIRKLSIEEIGPEPWKYETPIYGVSNELITIICEKGIYFMTDEADALKNELENYNLLPPTADQYRPNPGLNHNTRLKMLELGAKCSVIQIDDELIINYFTKEDGAFIAITKFA